MNGWMDGRTDGWIEEWMDGWIDEWTLIFFSGRRS